MARPIKNSCDYYPHDRDMRNHKKIKAIRVKFGISGYALWCMILEHLTGSDGNVFEYSDMEFELMAGDFGVSVTEIFDIVNYCIRLGLLFNKDSFISSESLDDRLLPVYEKRQRLKSKSKEQLRTNGKFISRNTEPTVVSVTEKPQSKVKEIRVKESKVKETIIPSEIEFLEHCKTVLQNKYLEYEFSLKSKYNTWVDNGWKNGYGKPIKNWKNTINNTIPHLKPIINGKSTREEKQQSINNLNKLSEAILDNHASKNG